MSFAELRLAEPILRALISEGYTIPTPIQAQAIPIAMEGRDILGSAQTGTGKTAAFALPILHRFAMAPDEKPRSVRCLVLCPTRELAAQIAEEFKAYGRHLKVRLAVVFGGVSQFHQVDALRRGLDVLVATPGRLLDLMNQGHVNLAQVEALVLDEADRMLDMGFIHDIRKIVAKLPGQRQTMMFSATMPAEIRRLADTILKNAVTVQVAPLAMPIELIDQSVYMVEKGNKPALLAHLINHLSMFRTIVFTRTKHGADRVVRHLHEKGIRAEAIHGNKAQNARQRAMANFKSSKTPVLVATDIASRGIDVDDVTHVVNYDLTHEPETYVHRIGRTARAGASGIAISFCSPDERSFLRAIERLLKRDIPVRDDQPAFTMVVARPPRPTMGDALARPAQATTPHRTEPRMEHRPPRMEHRQEGRGDRRPERRPERRTELQRSTPQPSQPPTHRGPSPRPMAQHSPAQGHSARPMTHRPNPASQPKHSSNAMAPASHKPVMTSRPAHSPSASAPATHKPARPSQHQAAHAPSKASHSPSAHPMGRIKHNGKAPMRILTQAPSGHRSKVAGSHAGKKSPVLSH